MPTYTYACKSCSAEIERRQSFADAPLTVCESCGGQLRRVLHPVGIVFKGSGFHNTDYKKSTNGSASDSKESEKSDGNSDAKPDAKSETKSSDSKESTPAKTQSSSSTTGETSTAKSTKV